MINSSRRISFHVQNLFSTSENMRSRRRDLVPPSSVLFTAENTYSIIQRFEYAYFEAHASKPMRSSS